MNIGKISANNIRRLFLSEEKICERLAKQNNKAAEKFLEFNFNDFPKGSAQEKLYDARTMLGKIAKDNDVHISFYNYTNLYKNQASDDLLINVSKNEKSKLVSKISGNANNYPVKAKKTIGTLVYKDKDNIDQCWPRVMNSEDNFLRTVYKQIEKSIKLLNNK